MEEEKNEQVASEKAGFWKKLLKSSVGYIIVAAMSSALTLLIFGASKATSSEKLTQLRAIIDEAFVGEVDETRMEDMMAAGMVQSLNDPWSYYVPKSQYQAFENSHTNSYVGIGVTVEPMDDESGYKILKVDPNGAAKAGGILAGDVIVAVNGIRAEDVGADEMLDMVSGEENTRVEITILREGEEKSFSLTRKKILEQVASGKMLTDTVGYIRIYNFAGRCAQETLEIFEELEAQGAKAMIFDVRFNPGGYVSEMVEVLDYLLPEGVLFRSENYLGITSTERSDASCKNMPMAVLINEDSVSAAEFFAAALREYEYAVTVGQNTLGKGYFQQSFVLNDGSAVNLSVGKYYTPKGVSLADAGGLTPDYFVDVDPETMAKIYDETLDVAEDIQLQTALELVQKKLS